MKKIVFLGLICAMSSADFTTAESNVYIKAGVAVQKQKDVVSNRVTFFTQYVVEGIVRETCETVWPDLGPTHNYVTWGGYLGFGINFGVSDHLSIKLELGSTIMDNKSKTCGFNLAEEFTSKYGEDPYIVYLKTKGNNSIPRIFTAVNVNVLKDVSTYAGVGLARLSNEAFGWTDQDPQSGITNIRYSPMFIVGAEKRFENFDVFAEVSYIQPYTRTLDEVMIKRENNWNCILGVTISLAGF